MKPITEIKLNQKCKICDKSIHLSQEIVILRDKVLHLSCYDNYKVRKTKEC